MKKSELFRKHQELVNAGNEVLCISLNIHMPGGEEEIIINPNVEEKLAYIDKTYNDDLVHANCADIYITGVDFTTSLDGMFFDDALQHMKNGAKVKLPSWGGYWYWDDQKKTVMMHTKDGEELDIRETDRVEYTLENLLSDEWIIADEENCPQLGGEAAFSFGEAIKYLKRGHRVARKGWNGKGMWIGLVEADNYIIQLPVGAEEDTEEGEVEGLLPWIGMYTADRRFVPWLASQTDMLANDWIFAGDDECEQEEKA